MDFDSCNFFDVIATRKTIRKYTNEIPPLEAIKKIADAGRLAPSTTNTQNWEFIAIYDNEIKEKMAEAVNNKYDELKDFVHSEEDKNKINGYKYYSMFFNKAPVVFAVVEKKRVSTILSILERNGMEEDLLRYYDNHSSLLSMGAAIENMSLCAHALGLSTCWMCAPLVAQKEFGTILGIKPEDRVITLLTVGYPDVSVMNPNKSKKTLDEVFKIVL